MLAMKKNLKQNYQAYINRFLYNNYKMSIIFKREKEILNISNNPVAYMDKKYRELIGEYIVDEENVKTI